MKKFIFILLICVFFIPNVNAESGAINGYVHTSDIQMPPYARFYNNNNGTLSAITTYFNNNSMFYYVDQGAINLEKEGWGGVIAFNLTEPVVSGYTYSLTLYLSTGNSTSTYPTTAPFYDKFGIVIGGTLSNAKVRFDGAYWSDTTIHYQSNAQGTFKILDDTSSTGWNSGLINFVFTANRTSSVLGVPFTSSVNSSQATFYGYTIESLGMSSGSLSENISSSVDLSGIATADSVEELQNEINQVEQKVIELNEEQKKTNEKLDNIDNTLKDNNVDNPNFEEFEEYIADNGVITQLITLPVQLYTQILNNINTTCSPFNLGQMFGHNLTMECINPSDFFGNALWNTIDILGTGLFIYAISKKMVAVFQQFTNLEEGDILD